MSEIKVGSPVWIFDQNRRVYRKNNKGISIGGPIWREHWGRRTVTGETSRSWIVDRIKIPKTLIRLPGGATFSFSEERINELGWVEENRHPITVAIRRIEDPALLRQIAKLIGYKERA